MFVVASAMGALAPFCPTSFNKSISPDNVVISDISPTSFFDMPLAYLSYAHINKGLRRTAMDDDFFYCSHLCKMYPNDLVYSQFL